MKIIFYVFVICVGINITYGHMCPEDVVTLNEIFNPTNNLSLRSEKLYHYNTNMIISVSHDDFMRRREFAYYVMTNVLEWHKNDKPYWNKVGKACRANSNMISMVCGFNCTTPDFAYIECVADFFGNQFGQSEYEFYPLDPLVEHGGRYYTRTEYSNKIYLLFYFSLMVLRYECFLDDEAIMPFRSNIVSRAKLDQVGVDRVWDKSHVELIRKVHKAEN